MVVENLKHKLELNHAPIHVIEDLETDYNKTIEFITKNMFRVSWYYITKEETERLLNILFKNKFTVDGYKCFRDTSSMSYPSVFLLASLKNDYQKTLDYLQDVKVEKEDRDLALSYDNYLQFKEIVKEHNIDVSKLNNIGLRQMYYYSIENGITILSKEEIEKCLLSKQKSNYI